jgi:ribose 5-phosphate isomerase B
MRLGLAADHGGFVLKEQLRAMLEAAGHEVVDFGARRLNPQDDYPDLVAPLAYAVAAREVERGVAVCGSGVGACVVANKVPGVRAALCYDEVTARNAREHNFANVLCLGGPLLGAEACAKVLRAFLETPEGAARHALRVDKIGAIEAHYTGRRVATKRILPQPGGG